MPDEVALGQSWSTWVSGRQQWLLATVIRRHEAGQATLKYDARYGFGSGENERMVDEVTMLTHSNLFRLLRPAADESRSL